MGKKHLNEDSFIHGIPPEFFMDYFNGLLTFHEKQPPNYSRKSVIFPWVTRWYLWMIRTAPFFARPRRAAERAASSVFESAPEESHGHPEESQLEDPVESVEILDIL